MDARERWQRLSQALDALLDLDAPAREARLAEIARDDPSLASELGHLLALESTHDPRIDDPLLTAPAGPREGEAVGPYRLERLLGEGGMGQVWMAARPDGLYGGRVALKLLRPGLADPGLRLRFSREREILARLGHPHIARLLDAGISPTGQPYLALEYVEGEGLLRYAHEHALDANARLRLFTDVCAAVSHAHGNLVVHRDLKPSNILVSRDGQVHLLDFGIAKLLDDSSDPEHTRTGLHPFTLHYAAPEQVVGEVVTTSSDVYSLGVVLYELLTGHKPYRLKRESNAQWEEAILAAEAIRPSLAVQRDESLAAGERRRRARELSGDLDNIVLKALAKDPAQRYASAEALSNDIRRYLDGLPVLARPQHFIYRAQKFMHRHQWPLAGGIIATALLVGLLGLAWNQRQTAVNEAARAQALQNFTIGLFESPDAAQGKPVDINTLVDAAEARGERELALQPRAHAELLGTLARIRIALGQYWRASDDLDRQQALISRLPRVQASMRLESETQRGRVRRLLGDPSGCVALLQPNAAFALAQRGTLPAHVAEFDSQYARCLRMTGDRLQARRLFEQSLALRRSVLADDIGVVENLTDLAALSVDSGDYDAALQGFEGALAQLRKIAGNRHPLAIDILRSLGTTERARGDTQAAATRLAEALRLSQSLQGEQHPATLGLRQLLAEAETAQAHWQEAQAQWLAVNAALSHQAQAGSEDLARSWLELGKLAFQLNDPTLAHTDLHRAIHLSATPALASVQLDALLSDVAVAIEESRVDEANRELAVASRVAAANQLDTPAFHTRLQALRGELAIQSHDYPQAVDAYAALPRANAQAVLWLLHARFHSASSAAAQAAALDALRAQVSSAASDPATRALALAALAEAECSQAPEPAARHGADAAIAIARAEPEGGRFSRRVNALLRSCPARPSARPRATGQPSAPTASGNTR